MTNAPPWLALQRAIRKQRLNYTQVAERAGISRQYVSHLANGRRRPTNEVIAQLATALSVPEPLLRIDMVSATSADDILIEIDGLIDALRQRMDTAVEEIAAKRQHLQQLTQDVA